MLHIEQGFRSKKNPVRYNMMNIAWLYNNAGLTGFGISKTGINHWRQYILQLLADSYSFKTSVWMGQSQMYQVSVIGSWFTASLSLGVEEHA